MLVVLSFLIGHRLGGFGQPKGCYSFSYFRTFFYTSVFLKSDYALCAFDNPAQFTIKTKLKTKLKQS